MSRLVKNNNVVDFYICTNTGNIFVSQYTVKRFSIILLFFPDSVWINSNDTHCGVTSTHDEKSLKETCLYNGIGTVYIIIQYILMTTFIDNMHLKCTYNRQLTNNNDRNNKSTKQWKS